MKGSGRRASFKYEKCQLSPAEGGVWTLSWAMRKLVAFTSRCRGPGIFKPVGGRRMVVEAGEHVGAIEFGQEEVVIGDGEGMKFTSVAFGL